MLTQASGWVRVNAAAIDSHGPDLVAWANAPGLVGIVVPKAERTRDLDHIAERAGNAIPVIALIESAWGLLADGVTYMITRPRHASIGELWSMPTEQV
jgi:citrate lyase beta subunit